MDRCRAADNGWAFALSLLLLTQSLGWIPLSVRCKVRGKPHLWSRLFIVSGGGSRLPDVLELKSFELLYLLLLRLLHTSDLFKVAIALFERGPVRSRIVNSGFLVNHLL